MPRRYRTLGAELPFGDLRRAHDRGMEGYFWRFCDPRSGRVVVALCGVCRDATGERWANVALAAHPGGFLRQADVALAGAASERLSVWADADGVSLRGDAESLTLNLAPDARLAVELEARHEWTRPFLGGVGIAQLIPGLGQYWHPYLFGALVRGSAVLDGERISLDGWTAYAEHNWGAGGFPPRWWWGQAQGFARPDVCVAFAGGDLLIGPARTQATSVVVAIGESMLRFGNPLVAPVHVQVDGARWQLYGRGPRASVEISGDTSGALPHILGVPLPAQRRSWPGAREYLAARLQLTVRRRGRVTFAGASELAGLETGDTGTGQYT